MSLPGVLGVRRAAPAWLEFPALSARPTVCSFRRWAMMLPASIQVCPVELPGRGRREGEEAISTVPELARTLARSLPLRCAWGRGDATRGAVRQ